MHQCARRRTKKQNQLTPELTPAGPDPGWSAARGGVGQGQVTVGALRIAALRRAGTSWRAIADELGVGVEGTVRRTAQKCAKNPAARPSVSASRTVTR